MTVLPSTAMHEAHHAAALCLAGFAPVWARIDRPRQDLAGSVRPDWDRWGMDDHVLREHLIATLMGPLGEGQLKADPDVCTWPLVIEEWPDDLHSDIDNAKHLCEALKYTQVDWLGAAYKAKVRARTQPFPRLVVAIARRLEEVELVLQDELIAISKTVTGDG
jgi:hypothetical protein